MLLLALRRSNDDGNGVTEFHDVVDEDLDEVDAGGFEFDLAEKGHVGGMDRRVLKREFDFAFAQDSGLVGSNQSNGLGELADASGPAIEEAELQCHDWQLRHAQKVYNADEHEVASDLLPDFFTQQGALEIG